MISKTTPREFRADGWDEALRDARSQNEALVVRGSVAGDDFELEPVALHPEAVDPFADACERAFDAPVA